jgi:AraC-like DNA-binding protein
MTIHQWVATGPKMLSTQESKPCRDLVQQAEKLALADLDEPLHISALCRALAVSERTLRKAFHKTYGLPPCRHLRMLRLSEARRALSSADCELTTVTEVAMCGDMQGYLNLKGYGEFDAANRPSGWNTWVTFSILPMPPASTVAPTRRMVTK